MSDLVLNARFLMRPPTGVDRVASELIRALLATRAAPSLVVLHPRGAVVAPNARPPALLDRARVSGSRLTGPAWEQHVLAGAMPGATLLSLCNMGPVRRERQVVMLHDAQVFRAPDSYARAFRAWYHLMQPRLGHRAALVLTPSDHARRDLERFGVVPPGKALVLPNGGDHILRFDPDPAVLTRNGLTPGRYFLAIGSLAPHKNIARLIRAAQARRDQSLPLVVAGGPAAGVFRDAGLQAGPGVRLIGRVSDRELRALYDHATALVFPSITEGFGLPPVEAMSCGCPVLASTGGAVPEVCGEAAMLIDPLDQDGWTSAMTRIAQDDTLRAELRQRGLIRAQAFTWDRAAQRLLHHLSDCDLDHASGLNPVGAA